jgi:hypothetical protein
LNPKIKDLIIRFQPSTITNSNILKGIDIIIGGSIIIPIDIKVLDTTISIIKKGIYRKKPISKAVLSSLIIKAGISADVGISFLVKG